MCIKKLIYSVGAVVVAGILWSVYYAISPLFRNVVVNESIPQSQTAETRQSETMQTVPVSVTGTAGHPASGTVRIIEAEGTSYIRYENFKTINGPDLYVYLAKDVDAKEYIDLGLLRATEGNVNYEIPPNVDLADYRFVLTWCKQFGVLFNYADLSVK